MRGTWGDRDRLKSSCFLPGGDKVVRLSGGKCRCWRMREEVMAKIPEEAGAAETISSVKQNRLP